MAYMDGKAAGRDKSPTTTVEDLKASPKTGSNQEKNTSVPKRTISPGTGKYNVGNQLKVGPNTKSTGTAKDPLNAYKKTVLPAGTNPDGVGSRPNTKVAAKSK